MCLFYVTPLLIPNYLLTGFEQADYYLCVSETLIIEELPADPQLDLLFEQARRNLLWFEEHALALDVFDLYRGRYIAVSNEELFVGESPEEVERLARNKHPDDLPHVRYIPQEKVSRIYAHQRQVDAMR